MAVIKLTFEVNRDQIRALEIVDANYKNELDSLVNKLVETQYKKKIDPKVRDFLAKMNGEDKQ